MSPAQKAVRTRNARQALMEQYGETTFFVLRDMLKNKMDDEDVCDYNLITDTQLAAYKAHLTMGTYDYALRFCNF